MTPRRLVFPFLAVLALLVGGPAAAGTTAPGHEDQERVTIRRLDADATVGGRPCRAGWLHLHPNGTPAAFTAARAIPLDRLTIPAGTWVAQDPAGRVTRCSFPHDTVVQGHLCRGTGGPKGVQTAFHPDGALWRFFPPQPVRIDGVPCATGLLSGWVELHANGRLKSCRLAEAITRDGRRLPRGLRVGFDDTGRLLAPATPP